MLRKFVLHKKYVHLLLNYSQTSTNLQTKWDQLDSFLKSQNREVESIPGDGFCFIQSLIKCLEKHHKIPYTCQSVIEININKLH